MRISFDYDGVLSTDKGKEMAINAIKDNNEVWILTARKEYDNEAVYSTAKKLGVPRHHIIFTNGKDKWSFVMRYKIDEHVDNNQEQIDKIRKNTLAKGTLFVDN
jgi:uncharacterized HAD superfamily protein